MRAAELEHLVQTLVHQPAHHPDAQVARSVLQLRGPALDGGGHGQERRKRIRGKHPEVKGADQEQPDQLGTAPRGHGRHPVADDRGPWVAQSAETRRGGYTLRGATGRRTGVAVSRFSVNRGAGEAVSQVRT